jgi:hypothetical protein
MSAKKVTTKMVLTISIVALVFGCKKPDIPEQAYGKGSTIVRTPADGGFRLVSIDLVTTAQTFAVLDVYKDATSEAALNTASKVVITQDPSAINDYNTAHGTTYIPLPATAFTTVPENPKTGNDFVLTFNPGEFYKQLKIIIPNASLLDLTNSYALGFTTTSIDNGKISATEKQVVVEVGIKNRWDGVYAVQSGFVQRYTAPGSPTVNDALNGSLSGQPDVTLTTVGPTTVEFTNLKWGSGSTSDVGGIANTRATIDPVTNQVTMSALGNTTLANWEEKENKYDPATKTFYLNFRWNPTANRREYSIVIKYKAPRS